MDRNRELDRIRYLEKLYDYQQANPGLMPSVSELFEVEFDEQTDAYWRSMVRSLADEGILDNHDTFGGANGLLNHRGEEYVEHLRAQRRNPAARRKAAAAGLLRWLDQQDPEGPSWQQIAPMVGRIYFEGEVLPEAALSAAAGRLAEDELVEAASDFAEVAGPTRVRLSNLGRRCVESGLDVDDFLQRERRQGNSVHNDFSGGTFNASNVAAGGSHFSQTLSSSGGATDDLKTVIAAVLELLPALGLPEDVEREVRSSAQAARGELERTDADHPMVKTLMGRIVGGLGAGAKAAATASLTFLIKYELIRMGIPAEDLEF
jgi:hypothetical protein